jgi:hypothetical protein
MRANCAMRGIPMIPTVGANEAIPALLLRFWDQVLMISIDTTAGALQDIGRILMVPTKSTIPPWLRPRAGGRWW